MQGIVRQIRRGIRRHEYSKARRQLVARALPLHVKLRRTGQLLPGGIRRLALPPLVDQTVLDIALGLARP